MTTCPVCHHFAAIESDGRIEYHANWGQGGAYVVHCPASGRTPAEIEARQREDAPARATEES